MRKLLTSTVLGLGLLAAPLSLTFGALPAAAQGHGGGGGFHGGGGGGFHGGDGFRGGGGFRGGFGGHEGFERHEGFGGYRGGFYGGYRGPYYGGFYGYGCCGYYGGYYGDAGLFLGAAAVAGVTALAVDSAYDHSYDRGYYAGEADASAPLPPPPAYYAPTNLDRRTLIDRCAHAAETDARGWSSSAKFVHLDSFDRDGPSARVDGVIEVTRGGTHYDHDGFPIADGAGGVAPVRFTCALDNGRIVDLRLDRPA